MWNVYQIDIPKIDIQLTQLTNKFVNRTNQLENKLNGSQSTFARLEESIIEELKEKERKDKSHFLSGRKR